MKDKVIESPLNGGLCYQTPISETKNSYFCFSTGFQTNALMFQCEIDVVTYIDTLP